MSRIGIVSCWARFRISRHVPQTRYFGTVTRNIRKWILKVSILKAPKGHDVPCTSDFHAYRLVSASIRFSVNLCKLLWVLSTVIYSIDFYSFINNWNYFCRFHWSSCDFDFNEERVRISDRHVCYFMKLLWRKMYIWKENIWIIKNKNAW